MSAMPPYIPVVEASCEEADEESAPQPRVLATSCSRPLCLRATGAATGALLLSAAAWSGFRQTAPAPLRRRQAAGTGAAHGDALVDLWTSVPHSHCGFAESDVEYRDDTSGFRQNFDHIPSPDICCAICQAEPRCSAWTWLEDAGLSGERGQCVLKGAIGTKVLGSHGMVSGTPPERYQLPPSKPGHGAPGNRLFCTTLMQPSGNELELVKFQASVQASIFACDAYAVYSNVSMEVAPGVSTRLVDSDLQCHFGGEHNSALNSWIFMAFWRKVIADREYGNSAWVVKVDPDTVFFPDRLLAIVTGHPDAQYFSNCRYGLHGPIEIFRAETIDTLAYAYAEDPEGKVPLACASQLEYGLLREDEFMDKCLDLILGKTNHPLDPRLLCENHCDCGAFYWCSEGSDRVSYHPFKSTGAYEACLKNAQQDTRPAEIPAEDYYLVNAFAPAPVAPEPQVVVVTAAPVMQRL